MTSITLRQKVETFIFLFVVIFICQKKSKNYSWRISIFLADLANFVQSFSAYYFVLFIFSVNFVSKQMLAINFDQISIEIKRWNSSDHFVAHLGCFFFGVVKFPTRKYLISRQSGEFAHKKWGWQNNRFTESVAAVYKASTNLGWKWMENIHVRLLLQWLRR